MITLTNGTKSFRVPAGAAKVYGSMGFYVAESGKNQDLGHMGEMPEADGGMGSLDDLVEKPLSQWTNEEVKEFVKIKGIDTSGVQKVSQVRSIIKEYLEGLEK